MDRVLINVVLDRSGSMHQLASDVRDGYNAFIAKQRQEPGEALVRLCIFDDHYGEVYGPTALGLVPNLTEDVYFARGNTALLDAVGRSISELDAHLAGLPDRARPDRVLFLINTDGLENASREHTSDTVRKAIKDHPNWEFVFMGANQDAWAQSSRFGVRTPGHAMDYAGTRGSTQAMWTSTNSATSRYRDAEEAVLTDAFFSEAERHAVQAEKYEDDEPIEHIRTAFATGEHGITAAPREDDESD